MRHILIACSLFLPLSLFCQRFGGTPPPVKWKQINTDTARIIFSSGLDSQARRAASIIHYMAAGPGSLSLGNKLQKIDIVLQNQTVIANGYVGLGPYRSEFYLTPALNNFDQGTVPWNDQLALHEYRHVQQFNNFNTGLSNVMRVLFGQEGYALAINASIPDWFYEGDAVYSETALSGQGRGRLPLFLNAYPSLWRAGKRYSWMKLRNGSFKDYVPSHYHLGYLLVNYGREKYGSDFWSKVTTDAAAFKGLLYPFQKAIKKHAGVGYKKFYNDAFNYYKDLSPAISKGNEQMSPSGNYVFPVNKRVVTSYLFPYNISGDSLLYLKTRLDKRPAFYIKDGEGEHLLRVKDISIDEQFSYRNGKIVYAAYEPDLRWSWRDYSVIKLLDVATRRQHTIRHKTKYFTPDISPSGEKIAAVEVAVNGKSSIHIIGTKSGDVVMSLRSAEINLFTDPKFIDDESLVCGVRLLDGKSALAIANISSGSIERLTPPSFNAIGYPNVSNGIVYFSASYGGNDDVYALRLDNKKIFKLSNGPFGNYFVNAGNGKITWSAFTAEGYQLQEMEEKDIQWTEVSNMTAEKILPAFKVSHDTEVGDILAGVPQRNFAVSNYRKGTRLLNFHSWRPYYEDPIFTFSLYGENILNTLQTEIYYLYDQNEGTHAAGVSAVYGRWFPYLSIGSQMTFARQALIDTNIVRQWNQLDSRIGINIPLNLTRGRTYNFLNAGTNYYLRNEFNTGPLKNFIGRNNFTYLHHFITWSQQVQSAVQHIFPRVGYSVNLHHRYAVTSLDAYQVFAAGSLYLPGVAPSHSIVLTGAVQQRDTLRAVFSSGMANARGHSDYYRTNIGSRMWRLSGNYHFPLMYPDWGFGNILYLQRFRANLFYDYQRLFTDNKRFSVDLRSIGAEFYADTKWWNQYELTFGFRISRQLDRDLYNGSQGTVFEFILPVSIIPK